MGCRDTKIEWCAKVCHDTVFGVKTWVRPEWVATQFSVSQHGCLQHVRFGVTTSLLVSRHGWARLSTTWRVTVRVTWRAAHARQRVVREATRQRVRTVHATQVAIMHYVVHCLGQCS